MKAIIIAGGLGTRLRPLTYNTPKPMVPVVNVPFILHQIALIRKYGIKEIILNLQYLSSRIRRTLEARRGLGVKLRYSIEEIPLGTCGAVKNAQQYFDDDPLLIFNGDILTDMDLKKLINSHRAKKAAATLTLVSVEDPTTYGLVIADKRGFVKEFIEKPSWERVTANTINAGIYVIEPKVFREVPYGIEYSFERELFPSLLAKGAPVYGYKSNAYWMDIGNPLKYIQAHRDILQGEVSVNLPGREIAKRTWVSSGTRMDGSCRIFGPTVIGGKCRIGKNSRIGTLAVIGNKVRVGEGTSVCDAVIWDGTSIGDEVSIKDCVIGYNCRIEDGVQINGGVVLADGSVVKRGSKLGIKL